MREYYSNKFTEGKTNINIPQLFRPKFINRYNTKKIDGIGRKKKMVITNEGRVILVVDD